MPERGNHGHNRGEAKLRQPRKHPLVRVRERVEKAIAYDPALDPAELAEELEVPEADIWQVIDRMDGVMSTDYEEVSR